MVHRRNIVSGLAGMVTLLFGITACTAEEPQKPATASSDHPPSVMAGVENQPRPTFTLPAVLAAPADAAPGEKLLFQTSSQRGSGSFGPFTLGARTVISLRCAGQGNVTLTMDDGTGIVLPCESDGVVHGIRNEADSHPGTKATISVESQPGQMWAVAIHSLPAR